MDAQETEVYKGHTIELHVDPDPESPREWDNLAEMHLFHNNYAFGDTNYARTMDLHVDAVEEAKENGDLIFPFYMYDHSGITISLAPFGCSFDSGQVGYMIARKEAVFAEFSCKRWSGAIRDKVAQIVKSEVETMDYFITGQVYGYVVDPDGYNESCWGYYGDSDYCLQEARTQVDWMIEKKTKQHIDQVKQWIKNSVPLLNREPLYTGA